MSLLCIMQKNTHTHTLWRARIHTSLANPPPSISELTAQRGCLAVVLCSSNPSLHHSRLLLMSDEALQNQRRSTKNPIGVCARVLRREKKRDNPLQIYLHFLQAQFRCVACQHSTRVKSHLAGQSKPGFDAPRAE